MEPGRNVTINSVVRSLPVKAGGSQYELIAIATDVEQNVNEGNDGIEHMYDNRKETVDLGLFAGYAATKTRMCLLTQNHLGSRLTEKSTLTFMEKTKLWGKMFFHIVESKHPSAQ